MNFLITGTNQISVDNFFDDFYRYLVKNVGRARKDLGMRIQYDEETGYSFDQEVINTDMLKEHGLELGYSVRVPINQDWNKIDESVFVPLPVFGGDGVVTVRFLQSPVAS